MRLNDAGKVIDIIDARVKAKTGTLGQVDVTYAKVAGLTGGVASAYLYGAATASVGFRAKNGLMPKANDAVVVAMNGAGDRWVEEVIPSAYYPMQFDVTGGVINWADATTGVADTNLYRSAASTLKTDHNLIVVGTLSVGGVVGGVVPSGGIILWSGTNLTVPTGWYICDGTNGTPDLRDRFIVGGDGTNNASGGTDSPAAALTGHSNHAFTQPSAHASHSHTGPSHTHTEGAHTHTLGAGWAYVVIGGGALSAKAIRVTIASTTYGVGFSNSVAGTGTPTLTDTVASALGGNTDSGNGSGTGAAGTGSTGTESASLSHSGGAVDAHSAHNVFKYYRLAYIMKA